MKFKIVLFILSLVVFSQAAFAAPKPIEKFSRGIEGILTSPIEYWNEYQMAHDQHSVIASITTSAVMGTGMMVKRLINGVYDIVAFPIPAPEDYRILLNDSSETALQKYYDLRNGFKP